MDVIVSTLSSLQAETLSGNPLPLVTAAVLIFVVYSLVKRVLNPPKGKAPPQLSGIPFFGNAIQFGVDPISLLRNGYNKFGEVFSMTMFGEVVTVFGSPEGCDLYFRAQEDEFSACKAYRFTVPVFGPNVVYDVPPDVLIEQRKFVAGGLTFKRFKTYIPIIEQEASEYFTEHWGEEGEAELMLSFNEVTVLTSTMCLQGKEIRNMSKEFSKLYWKLDESLSAIGFFFPNIPLPSMLGRNKARKRMGEIFTSIINKRRENPGEEHEDIIQTLMECKYKTGQQVPDDQIVSMMIALLLAGQHTSNVTGAWTGVHILSHPEVLERLKEEQKRVVGKELDFAKMKECVYLENCMKETLRVRPPIIITMRRVLKDMPFKEYTIRKGTIVAVAPSLNHQLPENFTNPEKFDPDRFSPERAEDNKRPFSFLAFGSGKHACIGESFAYIQVKTIWSWLLRNYEMELVSKKVEPNFKTMVVSPIPPVTVRFKRIKQQL